ncbi:D-tyrosyl-tRNA(Tyr) deacylase [Candidatus Peregrinibacteria bacterium]|nr:D-tyrosyl-tRNA(Tyr) deacylase [Candidatus Peregrinibacteria bacterium]
MKAVIQRVNNSKVDVSGKTVGQIGKGLLVLIGIAATDTEAMIDTFVDKISKLRIFPDAQDKMNLSLIDVKGEVLVVAQFTLYADCKGGRRPSFTGAAGSEFAKDMYKKFVQKFKEVTGLKVEEGEFGAMMDVFLLNSGPVTIILDSDTL